MTQLQQNAVNLISSLSSKKLKDAIDYLLYLKDKDEWEATYELSSFQINREIAEGMEQVKNGKVVNFSEIRKNV